MAKLSVKDLNVRGKRVFVRVDYNVPLEEKDGQMVITDPTRIVETLATLRLLIEQGAKLILAAHLGRPKGKREPSMSLRPVAAKLADLLGCNVAFIDDCIGEKVEKTVGVMKPGDVLLLENVRFYNEEEANDPAFAEKLARVADVYVNDAFGAAHRAHATTEGIAHLLPAGAGFLLEREVEVLGSLLMDPARPFVVVLGGAKVSDKMGVIERFLEIADAILIGGAMCFSFFRALGRETGDSLVEEAGVEAARRVLELAETSRCRLVLPEDLVVADRFDANAEHEVIDDVDVPEGRMGLDIGPRSAARYADEVRRAA